MAPRKRAASGIETNGEPVPKRRSARQATASVSNSSSDPVSTQNIQVPRNSATKASSKQSKTDTKAAAKKPTKQSTGGAKASKAASPIASKKDAGAKRNERAASEDVDVDSIPTTNPEAPRHEGEWYWLMKAEPETRYENGIDVRFSIDDLRAKTKPEGWDGIRAYAARNHMRNMNAGDKAFFYHSNCKEPGIAGTMEVVKEFSEDVSARRPGTPYYDSQSTKDKPRWSLVHVEFRKKFAVPISLKELREMGKPGGPLENMQMLKQSRLSVSRVSSEEWAALCKVADEKAKEAGLEHETGKLNK
ncbi:EVE domain protein [Metarhizium robertsii]|uniref:Thymocyte nuclear protein 1 n=2 Tax=Metarhizium robertsii TaxID=568076 RepID=E9EZ04_METRA|nr:AT DNA binding protein [Metarhizium robertsii ARSEF 23]EFY99195.1 AT DNA binding protein [Metarhizium robertsii ARSEF 23]EXV04782.1 EVE domain protein [Metarhizium robertsii]